MIEQETKPTVGGHCGTIVKKETIALDDDAQTKTEINTRRVAGGVLIFIYNEVVLYSRHYFMAHIVAHTV